MEINKYQEIIKLTAVYPKQIGKMYCALGLCGEAGEVAEKIKKLYRDNADYDVDGNYVLRSDAINTEFLKALSKEIGDVIWYCTALAGEFDLSIENILEMNFNKLIERKKTNTLLGNGDNREER